VSSALGLLVPPECAQEKRLEQQRSRGSRPPLAPRGTSRRFARDLLSAACRADGAHPPAGGTDREGGQPRWWRTGGLHRRAGRDPHDLRPHVSQRGCSYSPRDYECSADGSSAANGLRAYAGFARARDAFGGGSAVVRCRVTHQRSAGYSTSGERSFPSRPIGVESRTVERGLMAARGCAGVHEARTMAGHRASSAPFR
jgi:hypothetical protein